MEGTARGVDGGAAPASWGRSHVATPESRAPVGDGGARRTAPVDRHAARVLDGGLFHAVRTGGRWRHPPPPPAAAPGVPAVAGGVPVHVRAVARAGVWGAVRPAGSGCRRCVRGRAGREPGPAAAVIPTRGVGTTGKREGRAATMPPSG